MHDLYCVGALSSTSDRTHMGAGGSLPEAYEVRPGQCVSTSLAQGARLGSTGLDTAEDSFLSEGWSATRDDSEDMQARTR